jgi:menaquinone-9 beta-reductase
MTERHVDVAIVGGGPAGAATAIGLARAGVDVALFERAHQPKWRASGVYSSPLTRAQLAALGLDHGRLDALITRVPGLVVRTLAGDTCRLDYAQHGDACGVDRVRLDAGLLERAAAAGARVITSATVREIQPGPGGAAATLLVSTADARETWRARLTVGADGPGSMVARAFGVQRAARRLRRAGMTFHQAFTGAPSADAQMVIGRGWYCGICPVPGGRVNVGIVVGERFLRQARARGEHPIDITFQVFGRLPAPWSTLALRPIEDELAIALPLANRVSRRSGPGFVLVGDAAGFIDPISGEGLHRALLSAELATEAIRAALAQPQSQALHDYDRALRAKFRRKDIISWLLQAFLARPEFLGYAVRRLESRDELRATFAAVMADLEPPERALNPRFLAALLRP